MAQPAPDRDCQPLFILITRLGPRSNAAAQTLWRVSMAAGRRSAPCRRQAAMTLPGQSPAAFSIRSGPPTSDRRYVSAIVNTVAGTNATSGGGRFEFGQDLNGDGIIGVPALTPTMRSFSPDACALAMVSPIRDLLTLAGGTVANSTVKVYDGVTLLGSVTTNGTGAWNFATSQLTDGIQKSAQQELPMRLTIPARPQRPLM